MTPEFSRTVRVDSLGAAPRVLTIEAEAGECAALARRFDLVAIGRLAATAELTRAGETIIATGALDAQVTQSCAATTVPVPARIAAPFTIVFRPLPDPATGADEVELGEDDLDVVFYDSAAVDIGDAVAETLALSLDPYPRAPEAAAVLKDAGVKDEGEAGPFGALAGLKGLLGG